MLSGCASYLLAKYDTGEHVLINDIRMSAETGREYCTDSEVMKALSVQIYRKSISFKNYASSLDHNDDVIKAAESLVDITTGLKSRYSIDSASAEYCKMKLSAIESTSAAMQLSIARKPR
jgi:hypothetical protein